MGCITSEHKETKKKKTKKKKEAVQGVHVPWDREKKEKTPGDSPLLGLVSPHHPLPFCQLLVPVICRPLAICPLAICCPLIPIILVFSSPSFSPCRSSSPCPRPCRPLVVHPWSTLRAVAHSGGGGCWVAFVINSSSIDLKRFRNKNMKRE